MDGALHGRNKIKKGEGSAWSGFIDSILQGCDENKNYKDARFKILSIEHAWMLIR